MTPYTAVACGNGISAALFARAKRTETKTNVHSIVTLANRIGASRVWLAASESVTAAADNDFFDHDVFGRPVTPVAWGGADGDDYFLSLDYFAKHAVTVVQMQRGREGDEKLAAVRVRPCVGHRQDAAFGVAQVGMEFIFETI